MCEGGVSHYAPSRQLEPLVRWQIVLLNAYFLLTPEPGTHKQRCRLLECYW